MSTRYRDKDPGVGASFDCLRYFVVSCVLTYDTVFSWLYPMMHIGAISGGKDSVAMAILLKETRPEIEFTWVCTPTGNEPPEWFAHMKRLRGVIGPITPIMYPGGLAGLIKQWNALPNWRQRWCTRVLKAACTLPRNSR